MKRRRSLLIAASALLLVALTLIVLRYGIDRPQEARREDPEAFKRALTEAVNGADSFDLAAVAGFEWDRVHIFGPYTSLEEMELAVGTRWSMNSLTGRLLRSTFIGKYPLDDDSMQKLVFVRGDDVVLDVTLQRKPIDMAYAIGAYERGNAAFAIDRTKEYPTAVPLEADGSGT